MKKTASMYTPGNARGRHTFKINGYSLNRGLGEGKCIRSAAFAVGGHSWRVRYYPDAETEVKSKNYASVSLELVANNGAAAVATASFDISLIDQAKKLPPLVVCSRKTPVTFRANKYSESAWPGHDFLQPTAYVRDDSIVVQCDLAVVEPKVVETAVPPIPVPPPDLLDNLAELLNSQEKADVIFKAKGELFGAHKLVLAMRSKVFNAELFGPMSEGKTKPTITVEDIEPAVFKALLHYVYTDSLPSTVTDDLDGEEDGREIVKHLLVAADRYDMERMNVVCQNFLLKSLTDDNVSATLALADQQHNCYDSLREGCFKFINSPDRANEVVVSEDYAHLKRSSPLLIVEAFEKAIKSRKI